mgnify:CR=1 FL=1
MLRVFEILVKVLNKNDAGAVVLNVVGSESGERNSDVVAVFLRIKLKLEIVVPETLIHVVITGVGKSAVSTLESKAGRFTLGDNAESVGENLELVGGETKTSEVKSKSGGTRVNSKFFIVVKD